MLEASKLFFFDLRCLQDPNYRDRGVGRLSANLVGFVRQFADDAERLQIIGIVDQNLPMLEARFQTLVDEICTNSYAATVKRPACFIELSPLTHDPLFVARIVGNRDIFKVAIVYDFIPSLEPQRYLPTLAHRINYQTGLFWLSQYDQLFPISQYTAGELRRMLGVGPNRISLTSAPIDPSFLHVEEWRPTWLKNSNYILASGGGDLRKNVECPIKAHASSPILQDARIGLVITGNYPVEWKNALRDLYTTYGGASDLLSFPGHLDERDLVALYRNAICLIVPSRAEGFSLPVTEGMAAGTPVIASWISAHAELIEKTDFLFNPDDESELGCLLTRIFSDSAFRSSIVSHQKNRWQKFQANTVAREFWTTIEAKRMAFSECSKPMVAKGGRAQVAFLSPMPPDRSGVADYSAATLKELGKLVDIHVFAPGKNMNWPQGATTIQPLSALPYISNNYDRVVGVVGNSHFHIDIFQHLFRYGGACIEHDNRLLGFYRILLGEQRARDVAERELRRPLEPGELERWLADEATLEATFLGELASVSQPLCVHSRGTARLIRERFAVEPVHLPYCIYREWSDQELDHSRRIEARRRLGIAPDEFAIVTLGFVHPSKAPLECIWALNLLRDWKIPAKLYFVGECGMDLCSLTNLCSQLGVASYVSFLEEYVNEGVYRDFLLAADAAIQIRTHLLGGLSGALMDCIAAGLPTVANLDLAEAMEAPEYVRRIPDQPSPVLLAETLANIACGERDGASLRDARLAFQEGHNFYVYARRLCHALGIDVREAAYAVEATT